jgi:GntR family transcriptional regulator
MTRWTYRRIAEDIQRRIRRREYPPGSKIPSYRDLSLLYGVSIATVQRAVRVLRLAGVVVGFQGKGVFVAQR